MTTIPSGPSTNKPAIRPVPCEQLPAYSRNSDIKYTLKMPGLDIAFLLEPYNGGYYSSTELKEFTLNYAPSRFWTGSLIRRALGTQGLSYTSEDIRSFSSSYLLGVDSMFEVYLRHPKDTDRTLDDGPLMMINRDNGSVCFYPSGYNVDSLAIRTIAKNILTDIQQSVGKKFNGKWEKVCNSSS
ncbi:MAG: hypothetical protein HY094_10505 [Candidatus Melainabacteria bacterium]|nr:hypothetical protein [Candidatus Melainabacteria bacterium]